MTDLQDFRDKMSNYKSYREQNPGKTYLDWKKAIQELKHIDIDNDPTYDYKGYYDLNNFAAQDMLNKKSDAHFTDNFKTSQHPTFSEESGYSGYINKFNPNGITGGSWGDHSYNLSDSQMANDWDIKNTLDYLSIAENEGISLKYDDKYSVIDDTVIGGVLPEVEVKGYAGGGQIPLLGNKAKQFDSGVYPVRINTTNPYIEFNQEQNDAILSNAANNEFNSNVAVVFNPKDNVNFLGSSQDQKAFKQFVSPNNIDYIPISSERNNPLTRNKFLKDLANKIRKPKINPSLSDTTKINLLLK